MYDKQKDHVAASKANVWDEVAGIVEGVCFGKTSSDPTHCSVKGKAALLKTVQHVNMLPELIQMQVIVTNRL